MSQQTNVETSTSSLTRKLILAIGSLKPETGALTLLIAYIAFIVLGLPDGLLGVGWPSIRSEFGVGHDAQGLLIAFSVAGYLIASSNSGRLINTLGMGRTLILSSLMRALGLLGYALAPAWGAMVSVGALTGLGSGAIDAGLNTYTAANFTARYMNWLHACFGIGATFGPLVMTGAMNAAGSWRWGYATVAVAQFVILLTVFSTRRQWRAPLESAQAPGAAASAPARPGETLRLPATWVGIATFFLVAGNEVTVGNWAYTLFTEGRGIDPDMAGLWASFYWFSFTIGRILAGFIVARIGSVRLLRLSMVGAVIGALLIWANLSAAVSFVGLALVGFSIAPMFPLLISLTPARIGAQHAANAIGFQVGAAGVGIACLPALAGVLMTRLGNLEILGPYTTLVAVALLLLNEATLYRERRARPGLMRAG